MLLRNKWQEAVNLKPKAKLSLNQLRIANFNKHKMSEICFDKNQPKFNIFKTKLLKRANNFLILIKLWAKGLNFKLLSHK